MGKELSFKAQKRECSYRMETSAPASVVFPLLCPVKEYDWIDGWKCDLIYSESGLAEKFCLFRTIVPLIGEETWICTRYDLNRHIQYTRFSANTVTVSDIELAEYSDTTSIWNWSMTILSLNEHGNAILESFNTHAMPDKLKSLHFLLEHYLTTGTKFVR